MRKALGDFVVKSLFFPPLFSDKRRMSTRLIPHSLLPLLLCLFALPVRSQTTVLPSREDTQSWNELQLIVPLKKQLDLIFIGVLRLGRDISHPVDERIGAGLAFKVNKYVTFTPTYIYLAQQPWPNRKNFEHRLIPNLTVRFPVGKFNVTDRNLFEWRVRHALKDFFMYRNRLQIDHPARIGDFDFRIFVADEVFYSGDLNQWWRNRVSTGISKQFNKHFIGDFFYLYQHDGFARPGNVHALGTFLRVIL